MTNFSLAALALLVMQLPGGGSEFSSPPSDPVLPGCVVKIENDIRVPAREAGVLIHLGVAEGDQVRAGDIIGKIDDTEPQAQKEVAGYALSAAIKAAKSDVEIRFAEAGAKVAEAEHEMLLETNRRSPGAISQSDIRKTKLEHTKMILGMEKSVHDQELAKLEAYTKRAELKAAEQAIARRTIVAPFDGEVVRIHPHQPQQDEWVSPGDPIVRLVRLDVMNVEGAVDHKLYDPHEVRDCDVTVEVEMARGRKVKMAGRIKSVSPMLDHRGMYRVRAEIANQQESGRWLLRDGLPATMTIHLGTGGNNAPNVTRMPR